MRALHLHLVLLAKKHSRKKYSSVNKKAISIIGFSFVIAALDAVLKYLAIKRLPEEGGRFDSIIGFALHKNPGIAFDIPIPSPIVIGITLAIILIMAIFAERQIRKKHFMIGAVTIMVIMGSLGNMADRVINGFTTDYIILFNRSAINLSDLLIIFGIIVLLVYTKDKDVKN